VSYSPWIASVAAAVDDRRYKNHLTLGNGKILAGIGLSRKFHSYIIGKGGSIRVLFKTHLFCMGPNGPGQVDPKHFSSIFFIVSVEHDYKNMLLQ
jgi:hypothetical protein